MVNSKKILRRPLIISVRDLRKVKTIYCLLLDVLIVAFLILMLIMGLWYVREKSMDLLRIERFAIGTFNSIKNENISDIDKILQNSLDAKNNLMMNLLKMSLALITLTAAFLLFATVIKCFIWIIIRNEKDTKRFILKSISVKIPIWLIYLVITIVLLLWVNILISGVIIAALFFSAIYFNSTYIASLNVEKTFMENLKRTVTLCFLKIRSVLLPSIGVCIISLLILNLSTLLGVITESRAVFLILMLIFFVSLQFNRIYLYNKIKMVPHV
jgi:hypothetical protein